MGVCDIYTDEQGRFSVTLLDVKISNNCSRLLCLYWSSEIPPGEINRSLLFDVEKFTGLNFFHATSSRHSCSDRPENERENQPEDGITELFFQRYKLEETQATYFFPLALLWLDYLERECFNFAVKFNKKKCVPHILRADPLDDSSVRLLRLDVERGRKPDPYGQVHATTLFWTTLICENDLKNALWVVLFKAQLPPRENFSMEPNKGGLMDSSRLYTGTRRLSHLPHLLIHDQRSVFLPGLCKVVFSRRSNQHLQEMYYRVQDPSQALLKCLDLKGNLEQGMFTLWELLCHDEFTGVFDLNGEHEKGTEASPDALYKAESFRNEKKASELWLGVAEKHIKSRPHLDLLPPTTRAFSRLVDQINSKMRISTRLFKVSDKPHPHKVKKGVMPENVEWVSTSCPGNQLHEVKRSDGESSASVSCPVDASAQEHSIPRTYPFLFLSKIRRAMEKNGKKKSLFPLFPHARGDPTKLYSRFFSNPGCGVFSSLILVPGSDEGGSAQQESSRKLPEDLSFGTLHGVRKKSLEKVCRCEINRMGLQENMNRRVLYILFTEPIRRGKIREREKEHHMRIQKCCATRLS